VNCAAYTAVDKAEDNADLCRKLNAVAPGYLAKAAESRGAAMIQVSTDYVFNGTNHIPYTEEEPAVKEPKEEKKEPDADKET
jgi:dTDP-4-dehydrorhamnose reductase